MKIDINSLENNIIEMNEKISTAKELIEKLSLIETHVLDATKTLDKGYSNFESAFNNDKQLKIELESTINQLKIETEKYYERSKKGFEELTTKIGDNLNNTEVKIKYELKLLEEKINQIESNINNFKNQVKNIAINVNSNIEKSSKKTKSIMIVLIIIAVVTLVTSIVSLII